MGTELPRAPTCHGRRAVRRRPAMGATSQRSRLPLIGPPDSRVLLTGGSRSAGTGELRYRTFDADTRNARLGCWRRCDRMRAPIRPVAFAPRPEPVAQAVVARARNSAKPASFQRVTGHPLRAGRPPGHRLVAARASRSFHIGGPVAQLDRASGYEPEGREFESLRARQFRP